MNLHSMTINVFLNELFELLTLKRHLVNKWDQLVSWTSPLCLKGHFYSHSPEVLAETWWQLLPYFIGKGIRPNKKVRPSLKVILEKHRAGTFVPDSRTVLKKTSSFQQGSGCYRDWSGRDCSSRRWAPNKQRLCHMTWNTVGLQSRLDSLNSWRSNFWSQRWRSTESNEASWTWKLWNSRIMWQIAETWPGKAPNGLIIAATWSGLPA